MTPLPEPTFLDVEDNYQDVMTCAHCGADIEEGDGKVVWEPEPLYGPNAIVAVHPACAVKDGYRLRWPG